MKHLLITLVMFFTIIYLYETRSNIKTVTPHLSVKQLLLQEYSIKPNVKDHLTKGSLEYALAFKESTLNPDTINSIGCMGLFQFTESTLADLGYKHVTIKTFKADKEVFPLSDQRLAYKKLLNRNRKILKSYITEYHGTEINNITITESGILAAAHLSGPGGVIKFFKEGKNKTDIYGSSVFSYMSLFSSYKL